MEINLYEEMNEVIADIIAFSDRPVDLYASAYIKALRKEINEIKQQVDNLKTELGQAKAYIDGLEYVRAENEQLKEMYRMTVAIQEDKCEFTLDSEYAMIVEKGIINMFKKGGATNFLQLTVGDPENTEDKYSICIQKVEGMSPAEHFNSLREEIVNLTAAKEAAERDKANLERTIEEIYEALHVQGITLDCDGNVVPANKTINKYERLTPRDKIEVINVNHGNDMTRLILYAFNLWALENMLESGELIKVRKKEGREEI